MRALPRRLRGRVRYTVRRAESAVVRAWRRALVLRGHDWTEATARRSCLVLAAHPDDETFACGATILRKTAAGTPVKVLIATDGRNANPSSEVLSAEQLGAVRRAESREACALLGVAGDDLVQLDHPNLRHTAVLADVRQRIDALVEEFRPDEILVNSARDYHPDHRAMNRLVRELVAEGRWTATVAEYPIWYRYDGPWATTEHSLAGRPNTDPAPSEHRSRARRAWERVLVPVASVVGLHTATVAAGPYLDAKRAAVAAYRSQVTNLTGEAVWGYLGDDFVRLFVQAKELFFPWGG